MEELPLNYPCHSSSSFINLENTCIWHNVCFFGQVFIFGSVLEWSHYYNKYLYVAVWICNGLLQSTGWPAVVAVMGNWFGRSRSVSRTVRFNICIFVTRWSPKGQTCSRYCHKQTKMSRPI